jgi:hypothetical protein
MGGREGERAGADSKQTESALERDDFVLNRISIHESVDM